MDPDPDPLVRLARMSQIPNTGRYRSCRQGNTCTSGRGGEGGISEGRKVATIFQTASFCVVAKATSKPNHENTVRTSNFEIRIFAFLRAEGGKNIHFPARGSASEALAAFYQKICLNTVQLTMEFR